MIHEITQEQFDNAATMFAEIQDLAERIKRARKLTTKQTLICQRNLLIERRRQVLNA